MKKVLIIGLVILILILGGVWAYLLLNGAPENVGDVRDDIFGASGDMANMPTGTDDTGSYDPSVDTRTVATKSLLAKLTDRKVAGAVIVASSTDRFIRYMEKGTGNIFEINLDTGVETRISNQTIPQVVTAVWSPTGDQVVFSTDIEGTRGISFLGTLTKNDSGTAIFDAESFNSNADNVAFSDDGSALFYTEQNLDGGTTAFAVARQGGTSRELFSLPFGESIVFWDTAVGISGVHYAVTKPALGYQGFLYKIGGGGMLEKVDGEKNLTALRFENILVINKNSGRGAYSLLLDTQTGTNHFLTVQTLKEKCDGMGEVMWCGGNGNSTSSGFPIDWYQGSVSYADKLWSTDVRSGESTMVTDPEPISREQIDITDLEVSQNGIIFRNKRDDSLWLFNPPV